MFIRDSTPHNSDPQYNVLLTGFYSINYCNLEDFIHVSAKLQKKNQIIENESAEYTFGNYSVII